MKAILLLLLASVSIASAVDIHELFLLMEPEEEVSIPPPPPLNTGMPILGADRVGVQRTGEGSTNALELLMGAVLYKAVVEQYGEEHVWQAYDSNQTKLIYCAVSGSFKTNENNTINFIRTITATNAVPPPKDVFVFELEYTGNLTNEWERVGFQVRMDIPKDKRSGFFRIRKYLDTQGNVMFVD